MAQSASNDERRREARARRKAKAQGLLLRKSRVRTPNVDDFGEYMIVDAYRNFVVRGQRFDLTLEDVEGFLKED